MAAEQSPLRGAEGFQTYLTFAPIQIVPWTHLPSCPPAGTESDLRDLFHNGQEDSSILSDGWRRSFCRVVPSEHPACRIERTETPSAASVFQALSGPDSKRPRRIRFLFLLPGSVRRRRPGRVDGWDGTGRRPGSGQQHKGHEARVLGQEGDRHTVAYQEWYRHVEGGGHFAVSSSCPESSAGVSCSAWRAEAFPGRGTGPALSSQKPGPGRFLPAIPPAPPFRERRLTRATQR